MADHRHPPFWATHSASPAASPRAAVPPCAGCDGSGVQTADSVQCVCVGESPTPGDRCHHFPRCPTRMYSRVMPCAFCSGFGRVPAERAGLAEVLGLVWCRCAEGSRASSRDPCPELRPDCMTCRHWHCAQCRRIVLAVVDAPATPR